MHNLWNNKDHIYDETCREHIVLIALLLNKCYQKKHCFNHYIPFILPWIIYPKKDATKLLYIDGKIFEKKDNIWNYFLLTK